MGNDMSEEEERQFLEEAYSMSLDNPEVDKKINSGTTASNCQPKHTKDLHEREEKRVCESSDDTGLEIAISADGTEEMHLPDDGSSAPLSPNKKRITSNDGKSKKQPNFEDDKEEQKKLSYFQMARMGYQELVNAIIRPPRAEYKVSAIFFSA